MIIPDTTEEAERLQLKRLLTIKAASASVIVAALTAIASNFVQYRCTLLQAREARISHNIDLILKLQDQYDNNLLRQRVAVGKAYLSGKKTDYNDVLDFFDTVGELVKRDELDKERAWSSFYYYFHRYFLLSRDYVKKERAEDDDPLLWENVDYLHKVMVEIEQQKRPGIVVSETLTSKQIMKFMNDEKEATP